MENNQNIITFLNILSAIPILIYPLVLIAGAMSFDAPGSEKAILPWIIFFVSVGYPAYIIPFIIASRKRDSIPLAMAALVPFILFFLLFSITIFIGQMSLS